MGIVRAALDAADAGRLVREALGRPDVAAVMRAAAAVDVLAVGKAAGAMLTAFVAASPVPLRRLAGIVAAEPPAVPRAARVHVAAHPVPDDRSVTAARLALDMAAAVGERELLVVLLSGGASSLMALPVAGITLEDKQRTSRILLEHGAEIHALAAVRKHLSSIKGGRLAAAVSGSVLTLAVSDVVGDDLSAIGSGPTVPDETTFTMALETLDRYGGSRTYPRGVVSWLTRGAVGDIPETPKPTDPALARSVARVIGGRHTALEGARVAAESLGYVVHVIEEPVTGEARAAGQALVESAARTVTVREPGCILAAGETTVRVTGTGKGGRNQECALGMVRALESLGASVAAASIGTDGVDGPTDAAGAIVDSTTLARAESIGIAPPEDYLDQNNSYAFFDRLDDLMRTGPTNTNVGDVQVILTS